ncbi:ABC transporter domain-containing protein [Haematococcus lacustris]|uniref:ABC transporter domain-containing protein n=1 Tax=Haematococcus lacustris TaxID=44745 RepID=A0A699ZEM5_HAELA|nr:ABC transporter domain-containing protein [Haematococcus lacustris]
MRHQVHDPCLSLPITSPLAPAQPDKGRVPGAAIVSYCAGPGCLPPLQLPWLAQQLCRTTCVAAAAIRLMLLGVGDLILVYKRVSNLASHTSRVAELLEQVRQQHMVKGATEIGWEAQGARGCPAVGRAKGEGSWPVAGRGAGTMSRPTACFATSGHCLCDVSCWTLACSWFLATAVLAGLWPLQAGEITTPHKTKLFYLAQRPYLVSRAAPGLQPTQGQAASFTGWHQTRQAWGLVLPHQVLTGAVRVAGGQQVTGTLRDQLLYPFPPRAVWLAATVKERCARPTRSSPCPCPLPSPSRSQLRVWEGCECRAAFCEAAGREPPAEITPELDASLRAALAAVDLEYLALRGTGFDQGRQ